MLARFATGKGAMAPSVDRSYPVLVAPSLETVAADHVIQRALCRDLEALADGLPALPSPSAIDRLCARVAGVTERHFERAEWVIARLPREARPDACVLAAMREMHALDAMHGDDLMAALQGGSGGPLPEAQAGQLAYMLRCFFDGCRRAIALKESWIAVARRGAAGSAGIRPD